MRSHAPELKRRAVAMKAEGKSTKEIAAALGLRYWTVRDWVNRNLYVRPSRRKDAKAKRSEKSGVVAPRAYHYGSRWGAESV